MGVKAATRAVALVAAAAVLGGCAGAPDAGPAAVESIRAAFACEDGAALVVTFTGEQAVLESGSATARLAQQRAASGIHYAGGGHDLRGKGAEMTWTGPDGQVRMCRES